MTTESDITYPALDLERIELTIDGEAEGELTIPFVDPPHELLVKVIDKFECDDPWEIGVFGDRIVLWLDHVSSAGPALSWLLVGDPDDPMDSALGDIVKRARRFAAMLKQAESEMRGVIEALR